MGKILQKHGRLDEARDSFRVAAEELDTTDGYLELGKMLLTDDPAKETYLVTAAISGNKEACLNLGKWESWRAEGPGLSRGRCAEAQEACGRSGWPSLARV